MAEATSKEPISITAEQFRCVNCRMFALLDEHKRCEFCRREFKPVEPAAFTWRDMPWRGIAVLLAIFVIGFVVAFVSTMPSKK